MICKHPTCGPECRRVKPKKVRKPIKRTPLKKAKKIPIKQLMAKATKIFNNYIRERDKDLGCISCQGRVDHAGHYMNAGQHSALRFDENNVHGQCVGCNCFRHGNLIRYRQGLVNKIGETTVRELEATASLTKKWSAAELEEIINTYSNKNRRA